MNRHSTKNMGDEVAPCGDLMRAIVPVAHCAASRSMGAPASLCYRNCACSFLERRTHGSR